jgi:hypothetical protein
MSEESEKSSGEQDHDHNIAHCSCWKCHAVRLAALSSGGNLEERESIHIRKSSK